MASTQPASLTLLRVKRARAHEALDVLHVRLPSKRPRHHENLHDGGQPVRFRRLPPAADLAALGPSRVIDVDPALLRSSPTAADPPPQPPPPASGYHPKIMYNGVEMLREFVNTDSDEEMFDIFAPPDQPQVEHLLSDGADDQNIAWVHADNLPLFDHDSSDEEDLLSDSDDQSVDYPSTPEKSAADSASEEDEWRRREAQMMGSGDEWDSGKGGNPEDRQSSDVDEEKWGVYGSDRDLDSDPEGDNYDYDA